jgi:hypothetical protein
MDEAVKERFDRMWFNLRLKLSKLSSEYGVEDWGVSARNYLHRRTA